MDTREGRWWWGKALLSAVTVLALAMFLVACGGGGGGDPFGSERPGASDQPDDGEDGDDPDSGPGSDDGDSEGLAGAAIMRGTSDYDPGVRVINSVFSVLDANGDVIEGLDGGDFEIAHDTALSEGHHDARRLPYPDQLGGRIHLLLDISNSMASDYTFPVMQAQAVRFVTEMAAFGLAVHVYTFSNEEPPSPTPLGVVSAHGDPTSIAASINNLQPEDVSSTRFAEIISTKVAELVTASWNEVTYPHSPLGNTSPPVLPSAQVELMVIMSDGHDTAGGSFGGINTAKDEKFNIVSIALGSDPNVDGLNGISEYLYTVPEGGSVADAVGDAIAGIKNYYQSFYVVDYMPPAILESGDETYTIKLIGNEDAGLNVKYALDAMHGLPSVQPYCCKLRIGPGLGAVSPVTFAVGSGIEFRAVKLWTADQPTFTWTFSSDGNMSINTDKISIATVTAERQSNATIAVEASSESWSEGPVSIQSR